MDVSRLRSIYFTGGAIVALLIIFFPPRTVHAKPPAITLAQTYQQGVDVSKYWVSEKLDGVRAYWDGSRLISRGGNVFAAPDWFTAGFPQLPLDGELWMGRNSFERLAGTVRSASQNNPDWHKVRYMVFDLPLSGLDFGHRLARLQAIFEGAESPFIELIEQYRLPDHQSLMRRLQQTVAAGGEGLMLHLASADYHPGRSGALLKVKPYLDAEARVVAHLPGKGKYRGSLGALLLETDSGLRFKVGTGFSDAQRHNPPAVGAWVSYRYHGFTKNGIPRFASFLRIRKLQ